MNKNKTTKSKDFTLTPYESIGVVLVLLLISVVAGLFMLTKLPFSFTLVFSFGVPFIITTLLIRYFVQTRGQSFLLNITHLPQKLILIIPITLLLFLSAILISEFLINLIPTTGVFENMYKAIEEQFGLVLKHKVAAFITICILAPILEELIFRGIILRGLLNNGYTPLVAIGFSSFLFGALHFNIYQFIGAGILGFIMGYVFYKTNSLILSIGLHATNNIVSFYLYMKYAEPNISGILGFSETSILLYGIFGVILFGYLFHLLTKNLEY